MGDCRPALLLDSQISCAWSSSGKIQNCPPTFCSRRRSTSLRSLPKLSEEHTTVNPSPTCSATCLCETGRRWRGSKSRFASDTLLTLEQLPTICRHPRCQATIPLPTAVPRCVSDISVSKTVFICRQNAKGRVSFADVAVYVLPTSSSLLAGACDTWMQSEWAAFTQNFTEPCAQDASFLPPRLDSSLMTLLNQSSTFSMSCLCFLCMKYLSANAACVAVIIDLNTAIEIKININCWSCKSLIVLRFMQLCRRYFLAAFPISLAVHHEINVFLCGGTPCFFHLRACQQHTGLHVNKPMQRTPCNPTRLTVSGDDKDGNGRASWCGSPLHCLPAYVWRRVVNVIDEVTRQAV